MKSYITFKEKGFWTNDSIMQVVLGYLYCSLKDDLFFKEKKSFLEILHENSMGTYASFMHLNMEEHLDANAREVLFARLIALAFELNNGDKDNIMLEDLCNYSEYQAIEYYLPKTMAREILISNLLKLAYLLEEHQ